MNKEIIVQPCGDRVARAGQLRESSARFGGKTAVAIQVSIPGVSQTTTAYVALLRGVNLGRRKVPMPELARIFVEAGAAEVRTYINSGNVVFRATAAQARRLPRALEARLQARFGFEVPVLLRSAAALARIVRENPFAADGADPKGLFVSFLAERPSPAAARRLDPMRSPGDRFVLVDDHLYLHLTNGAADTRLTNAYFDGCLGTVSTARNWRTVVKLHELAGASRPQRVTQDV